MKDYLNEVERFSPFGGELIREEVLGSNNKFVTAENSIETAKGADRSMYSYIPASGCYDAKQCQVLMVLRDGDDYDSAYAVMKKYELDDLAEKNHFILLFPNAADGKWNYEEDPARDDDCSFFARCFASLPKSKGTVAGFNGMIFYIGTSKAANAMLAVLTAKHPIDCAAMLAGNFPEGFHIPEGVHQPQVAWTYEGNTELKKYIDSVNKDCNNPNVKSFYCEEKLSAELIRKAWDQMFSEARRWRNDTYGTYQERTNFTEWGFVPHVKDTSLGVNNGFAHTWYEYVPESVRNSDKKVPLLFYFHGGNCIPLYGAEQSDWHKIARREGFMVVYPKASTQKRWNVWDDEGEPSDIQFVLALIDHMKKLYPVDEKRIYISGFSMGSMMTNALACSYPEVFAAGAAYNAQNLGYFKNLKSTFGALNMGNGATYTEEELNAPSKTRLVADAKKKSFDFRFPLIQDSGLLDALGTNGWPITSKDNIWLDTFDYWKAYNNIPVTEFEYDPTYETGLKADESCYAGDDQRFIYHKWFTNDESHLPLYQVMVAKRMPHAVDLRQIEYGWNFIRHYYRNPDGTLGYDETL